MTSTIEYGQFQGWLATIHMQVAGMSPRLIAMVPDLRQKMAAFKTQNRNLYFQFVNQAAKGDAWLNNGIFEELKELVRREDSDGLNLYSDIKKDFLKAGLEKHVTDESLGISTFNWPIPQLEGLAKCISFDLSRQDYDTLNQVLELLMGNVEKEQKAALYVLKTYVKYAKSLQMSDPIRDQIIRRAFALTHPEYTEEVKLRAVEFFYEIAEISATDAVIENCLSNDEIQQLFECLLPLTTLSTLASKSVTKLKDLFYEHVPGFIHRTLRALINERKNDDPFRHLKDVFYELVDLEHDRKLAVEEFEDYDIPHFTIYHNDLATSSDVISEILPEIYQKQQRMNQRDGIQKAYLIDKIEDLASLLDLPVDLEIPSEMKLHFYAGIKRDYTAHYDNLVDVMEQCLSSNTLDYFITKNAFDRFQVPSDIIERKIEESCRQILRDHSKASRAQIYCPTSVNLNAKVRNKLFEIKRSRLHEPLLIDGRRPELRLAVEIIELIRIVGIKATEVDAILQQYLPIFGFLGDSSVADTLHKYFNTLLQICRGSISDTTATQYLQEFLLARFAKFTLSSVMTTEFSVLVNAVTSLGSNEAKELVKMIGSRMHTSVYLHSNSRDEDLFELLHLIGQHHEQLTITDLQDMVKGTLNKKFYNIINSFAGFTHLIGSQELIELVINILKKHLHDDDDVQLELILRGLNNLLVAHKKKSCAELFTTKMEALLNLIQPAFTDPSNETLLAFLHFIRNVLHACPDVTSVLQNHVTVSRAIELALSPSVLNLTLRDYANQVSTALKSQAK